MPTTTGAITSTEPSFLSQVLQMSRDDSTAVRFLELELIELVSCAGSIGIEANYQQTSCKEREYTTKTENLPSHSALSTPKIAPAHSDSLLNARSIEAP